MDRAVNMMIGCFITSVGTMLLQHSHLVIGGTAGLSLSLSYLFNIPFPFLFFIVNIPFYIFSVLRMGWNFTIATFFAITALSCMTAGMERWLFAFAASSALGAVVGGGLTGLGLTILFVNRASLGGANILALYLEKKYSWNPGLTNLVFDGVVVLSGIYSVGMVKAFYSVLAVVVISGVIGYLKGKAITKENDAQTIAVSQLD